MYISTYICICMIFIRITICIFQWKYLWICPSTESAKLKMTKEKWWNTWRKCPKRLVPQWVTIKLIWKLMQLVAIWIWRNTKMTAVQILDPVTMMEKSPPKRMYFQQIILIVNIYIAKLVIFKSWRLVVYFVIIKCYGNFVYCTTLKYLQMMNNTLRTKWIAGK